MDDAFAHVAELESALATLRKQHLIAFSLEGCAVQVAVLFGVVNDQNSGGPGGLVRPCLLWFVAHRASLECGLWYTLLYSTGTQNRQNQLQDAPIRGPF